MAERVRTVSSRRAASLVALLLLLQGAAGCRSVREGVGLADVRPRSLRDVPAERLAFRFEPDVPEERLPERVRKDEAEEPLASIRADFEGRRGNTEALIRTVVDPTGQRALALYGTGETDKDFRIDLYSTDGQFLRNVLPRDLTGVFPAQVAWSPDGQHILFSGVRNPALTAAPTPREEAPAPPELAPGPPAPPGAQGSAGASAPTPGAIIPSVQTFTTEQVYVGNRDGFELRPLTLRDGLIYFELRWSPDGQSVAALACKEDEYNARLSQGRLVAGRPRVITLAGEERLLDDRLTQVAPAFSPDASKVATAFEFEVAIYDAASSAPTAGAASLAEALREASVRYDERVFKRAAPGPTNSAAAPPAEAPPGGDVLISYNPFVRLEWSEPELIYAQTAYVQFFSNEPAPTIKYLRWHAVRISPQAALLAD